MTLRYLPLGVLALALAIAPPSLAATATDQTATPDAKGASGMLGLNGTHSKQPMHLNADGGIEWQQATKSYIARKNAVATRGNVTLRAETITAYYRDAAKAGNTEVWRVVAEGGVRITTPSQSVVGDVATYDLDRAVVVVTGSAIRLVTPQDIVTARDSLEWYDQKQLAVARGKASVKHGVRTVRADILAAQIVTAPGQPAKISKVNALGHVQVSGPGQLGTGDKGVYDARTGKVTLRGHVVMVRGENTLTGEYGIVDLSQGVSRLMPATGGDGRVHGYIVPPQKGGSSDENPR